jgi:hypothetical protein
MFLMENGSRGILPTLTANPMSSSEPVSKGARVTGYVLTTLPSLLLIFSGALKLIQPAGMMAQAAPMGFSAHQIACIGVVEISCALIYAIPATCVLGAILCAAYLGGAVCISVRAGVPYFGPIIVGFLIWGGLFLRDPRIRALIPLRS